MKKMIILFIFLSMFVGNGKGEENPDKDRIRSVITEGYFEGFWLNGDEVAMRKGFDTEFVKVSLYHNHVHKTPLNMWIENLTSVSQEEREKFRFRCDIPLIDVTGNAAVAKVEILRGGKIIVSDYLSLYKFGDYWQIVNMITFDHK